MTSEQQVHDAYDAYEDYKCQCRRMKERPYGFTNLILWTRHAEALKRRDQNQPQLNLCNPQQFMLFAGHDYYPDGGWNDYEGTYATLMDAVSAAANLSSIDWFHIVLDGAVVQQGRRSVERSPGFRAMGSASASA